jgi:hypothetical protein
MNENTRYNNQSTVILDHISSDRTLILMMHQSRFYAFIALPDIETQVSQLRESLLDLLTHRKYRILACVYAIFHATDNIMLVLIVLTSIMGKEFELEDMHQAHVLGIFSVDIFNTYLEMQTKFWLLHRIQPYIGFALYITYASVLFNVLKTHPILCWLLVTRGVAFLLELVVDYAIDLEIHYDLCNNGYSCKRGWLTRRRLQPLLHRDMIVDSYQWSQCAWIMVEWIWTQTDTQERYRREDSQSLLNENNPAGNFYDFPFTHVGVVWGFGVLCLFPFFASFSLVGIFTIFMFWLVGCCFGLHLDSYVLPL